MIRSFIYNKIIIPLTKLCYFEVLSRLPPQASLLDVGIGTGTALCANKNIISDKRLQITGIDIDAEYLQTCQQLLEKYHLENAVTIKNISFYDFDEGTTYDAIYFSSSFMLLPDQQKALQHAKKILSKNGKIYFTQTLHFKRNCFMEMLKPKLVYLTSIHFGKITYEKDFFEILKQANLTVIEYRPIKKWRFSGEQLIVVQPT